MRAGTRELVFTGLPFVAVYRIREDVIEISRILHGAQKWPLVNNPANPGTYGRHAAINFAKSWRAFWSDLSCVYIMCPAS